MGCVWIDRMDGYVPRPYWGLPGTDPVISEELFGLIMKTLIVYGRK